MDRHPVAGDPLREVITLAICSVSELRRETGQRLSRLRSERLEARGRSLPTKLELVFPTAGARDFELLGPASERLPREALSADTGEARGDSFVHAREPYAGRMKTV